MNKKYRWGTMIPLIGGSAVGCSAATGDTPLFHFSLDGFQKNDIGIVNYWKGIEYHNLDQESFVMQPDVYENIDFVNSVCPCAALCRLNTTKGEKSGSNGIQNRWMYISAEIILGNRFEEYRPKVYWGENAPALAGEKGQPVVDKLIEIGKKYGYTFSLYKTSTIFHGLPQKRDRCFYFFWKGDKTPIINFYDRERLTFVDFLEGIDKNLPNMNDFCLKEKPTDFVPLRFLMEKFNLSYKEIAPRFTPKHVESTMGIIFKEHLEDELVEWMEKYHKTDIMNAKSGRTYYDYVLQCVAKNKAGGGMFTMGPRFCLDYSPAVISKTCYSLAHPTENRYISYREYMKLMGMPDDFMPYNEDGKLVPIDYIGQNVPVNAARDMCTEVLRFIDNDPTLEYVENDGSFKYIFQNNLNKTITKVK